MSRRRIAFFSPFSPERSGVSDYSEELLPHLAAGADVDLVADGYRLTNPAISAQFQTLNRDEFFSRADSYDMPVYQVANSLRQHGYMIPCMERFPGVVVLHDFYLHYLMLGLTVMRGDYRALRRIVRAGNDLDASLALLLSWADPYQIELTSPILDRARSVITHSELARDLALRARPGKPIKVIPMAMPEIDVEKREEARAALGVAPGDFVLASVSTLSYTKRIETVLGAVMAAGRRHANLRLWILGGGKLSDRATQLVNEPALKSLVRVTGWADAETYGRYLLATDAAIDLRYPSGAETSASLMRAFSAGVPAIVSRQGTFMELPDSFTEKIQVNEQEVERVVGVLAEWISDPEGMRRRRASALEFARTRMHLPHAAASYLEWIEETRLMKASGQPTPLSSHAGKLERMWWGSIHRGARIAFLIRTYGWESAWQRARGGLQARQ
ncbi:MAG TPA: glycosyltransferase family 4 protein [Paludibaculum sp.]|jgi:glycosyltransferase involved in cell wall biosynthesis